MARTRGQLEQALSILGFREDDQKYLANALDVFAFALEIMDERQEKYGDGWKKWGWRGQLIKMKDKERRVWSTFWKKGDKTADLDDAIDLLNYTAFFIMGITRDIEGEVDW
jgi:hypothetical protein